MGAHRRAQHLGGVRVGRAGRQQHRLHRGRGGGAQNGAQVARVAHAIGDEHKIGLGGQGQGAQRQHGQQALGRFGIAGGLHHLRADQLHRRAQRRQAIGHLQAALAQVCGVQHQAGRPGGRQALFAQAHPFHHEDIFAAAELGLGLQLAHPLDARVLG